MLAARSPCSCKAFQASKKPGRAVAAYAAQPSRRGVLEGAAAAAALLVLPSPAQAKVKGFVAVKDGGDGYEFLYPFGWQEVSVKGVDAIFKDVIEPLESVAVQIVPTDKVSITEFGPANEVGYTIADKILTGPDQEVVLVTTKEETVDNREYVQFEFLAKGRRYTRHTLGVATVANGKLMLLSTGANERRWPAMKDKLETTLKSFKAFDVYSG